MSEAKSVRNFGIDRAKAEGTIGIDEVFQTPTGKAGAHAKTTSVASGTFYELETAGQYTLAKKTGFKALKGGRAYWDYSANACDYKKSNDRDFYVGRFAEDAESTGDFAVVDLNADPPYDVDLLRDAALSVLVGTAAAGGFGYPVRLGGTAILELTATNEAQKVDLISQEGFDRTANAIVELEFNVISDGAGTNSDVSLGLADETHSSDADLIAQSMLIHLNGNEVNIYAESDDGDATPIEVAATDTTIDYTEGGELSKRVYVWWDMRDAADVQLYVNGSNVLAATVFNMADAVGPLRLLAHLEKALSADVYKLAVHRLCVRFAEQ